MSYIETRNLSFFMSATVLLFNMTEELIFLLEKMMVFGRKVKKQRYFTFSLLDTQGADVGAYLKIVASL